MPNYTFKNSTTGDVIEMTCSIAERDDFEKENPQYEQVIVSPPSIGYNTALSSRKPDQGFRELLRKIKKGNRGSNINTW